MEPSTESGQKGSFVQVAWTLKYSENHFWLIHNEFEPENDAWSKSRSVPAQNRRIVNIRHYLTYGDELPIYQQNPNDSTRQALALAGKEDADGLTALQAHGAQIGNGKAGADSK